MNEPKIYIISGKAGSGKDTVADILKDNLKGKTIIISYASYLKEYAKNIVAWDGSSESKPRTFLQEIGDLVKSIDPNFLVNRILEDIEVYKHYYQNIIISDARFVSEIKCIEEKYNSLKLYVYGRDNNLTDVQKKHNTETSLDGFKDYDYVINNNGTLEELKKKVLEVLEG
jgi:phosphomevalonate kinase